MLEKFEVLFYTMYGHFTHYTSKTQKVSLKNDILQQHFTNQDICQSENFNKTQANFKNTIITFHKPHFFTAERYVKTRTFSFQKLHTMTSQKASCSRNNRTQNFAHIYKNVMFKQIKHFGDQKSKRLFFHRTTFKRI